MTKTDELFVSKLEEYINLLETHTLRYDLDNPSHKKLKSEISQLKEQIKMEANKDLEKQILEIWAKKGTVTGWTETGWPICIEKEDCAKETIKLFDNMYPVEFIEWFTGKDYIIEEQYKFWKTEVLKKNE
jgi:predicted lipase